MNDGMNSGMIGGPVAMPAERRGLRFPPQGDGETAGREAEPARSSSFLHR
ncbi:hypothetical protein ACWC2K_19225 [Streptomyces chattanoogensis]